MAGVAQLAECVNFKVGGKLVKSPVDIDKLPSGRYRLAG